MHKIFRLDRLSVVLSGLALLIALSGTAYAVNSVRSRDIVNNTIKSVDVRNGSLQPADHAATSLGASTRRFGTVGIDGELTMQSVAAMDGSKNSTGSYTIQLGGPVSEGNCVILATPQGNTAVHVGADVASSTAINLYVIDTTGNVSDAIVDFAVIC